MVPNEPGDYWKQSAIQLDWHYVACESLSAVSSQFHSMQMITGMHSAPFIYFLTLVPECEQCGFPRACKFSPLFQNIISTEGFSFYSLPRILITRVLIQV